MNLVQTANLRVLRSYILGFFFYQDKITLQMSTPKKQVERTKNVSPLALIHLFSYSRYHQKNGAINKPITAEIAPIPIDQLPSPSAPRPRARNPKIMAAPPKRTGETKRDKMARAKAI